MRNDFTFYLSLIRGLVADEAGKRFPNTTLRAALRQALNDYQRAFPRLRTVPARAAFVDEFSLRIDAPVPEDELIIGLRFPGPESEVVLFEGRGVRHWPRKAEGVECSCNSSGANPHRHGLIVQKPPGDTGKDRGFARRKTPGGAGGSEVGQPRDESVKHRPGQGSAVIGNILTSNGIHEDPARGGLHDPGQ